MGLLARGEVDAGFIGGAEIDVHGNLNTTAIGPDRAHPAVQLPGSGGGADIASLAKRLIVIMPHDKKRLRETVDFITSPGYLGGGDARARAGLPRGGPSVVITTRAVYRFSDGKLYLWSVHPGEQVRDVVAASEWRTGIHGLEPSDPQRRAAGIADMEETQLPSQDVLRIIRDYDREGFWTRRGE
jgi:glutaconate CoA-transferase subunit B